SGLYDLFLHSQDRPYTVPDVYDMLEKQGLNLVTFTEGSTAHLPAQDVQGPGIYDPAAYIRDAALREQVRALSKREQHTIAELMHGQMIRHTFYAAPFDAPPSLNLEDEREAVPFLCPVFGEKDYAGITQAVAQAQEGQIVKIEIKHQAQT